MKTSTTTTLAALSAILVSPAVGSAAILDREPDASAAHQPGRDATAQPLQVYAALLARQLPSVSPQQLAAAAAQIADFHGDKSMDKRDFRSDLEGSLNQALVHLCDIGNMEKLLNQLPVNEANQIRSQLAVGCRPDGGFTPVKLPLIGRADPASSMTNEWSSPGS